MTEPLLLATMTVGVAALMGWTDYARVDLAPGTSYSAPRTTHQAPSTSLVGTLLALACLTRYEAWPVTACALTGAVWARWRQGEAMGDAVRRVAVIAIYPALALVGFAIFSRVVVGQWFVSSDFFVAENKALGHPWVAVDEIAWGRATAQWRVAHCRGFCGRRAARGVGPDAASRGRAHRALARHHPPRSPGPRSSKGTRSASATWCRSSSSRQSRPACWLVRCPGVARGSPAPSLLLALAAYDLRPLDLAAPMVVEAQWDRPNAPLRARVTACLGAPGGGVKIMASMGSLGPLHAGSVRVRLCPARLPARGQRRHLAGRASKTRGLLRTGS